VNIIISNTSTKPLYDQIAAQIKDAILAGDLREGDPLPSIRALANDLRVSIITTKRAYQDLEAQGFINSFQGKGSFVAQGNRTLLREDRMRRVEDLLDRALEEAKPLGIGLPELHEMLDLLASERDA